MSTTPPEEPRPGQRQISVPATLPTPGNAELVIWLLVEIVIGIVWAASDALDATGFVTATTILTAAYLLSRGIAKASRVYEH